MNRLWIYLLFVLCMVPYGMMIWAPEAFSRSLAVIQSHLWAAYVAPIYMNGYIGWTSYQSSPRRFRRTMAVVCAVGVVVTFVWLYWNLTLLNILIASVIPVAYSALNMFAHEYERHVAKGNS